MLGKPISIYQSFWMQFSVGQNGLDSFLSLAFFHFFLKKDSYDEGYKRSHNHLRRTHTHSNFGLTKRVNGYLVHFSVKIDPLSTAPNEQNTLVGRPSDGKRNRALYYTFGEVNKASGGRALNGSKLRIKPAPLALFARRAHSFVPA